MAKNSAKSKGYRKTHSKRPYLSRREIIALCLILAVVAVAAILLFSYDDGALKTKDGAIVDAGENWLIVNGSRSSGTRRYFKLGEAGDVNGYDRETVPLATDANINTFVYTPQDEDSPVSSVSLSPSARDSASLAENYAAMYAVVDGFEISEISTAVSGDIEYRYYLSRYAYYAEDGEDEASGTGEEAAEEEDNPPAEEEAPAEEDAAAEADEAPAEEEAPTEEDAEKTPNHFTQSIAAFIDGSEIGAVMMTAGVNVDSEEDYLDENALKAIIEPFIGSVSFEKK